MFARAIAGKSDLFVLDEATSSVDSVTENLIQKAIERIFKDKTVIAIAHRLSTIRHSTTILVISNGLIAERGNHAELVSLNGIYAQLLKNLNSNSLQLFQKLGMQTNKTMNNSNLPTNIRNMSRTLATSGKVAASAGL